MTSLLQAFNWRYATKKFDTTKKLTDEQLSLVLEAARLAPSSYGLQPWKFIVVKNPETRTALRAASWDQSQVTDASALIVFAVPKVINEQTIAHYMENIAAQRGIAVTELQGFSDMLNGALGHLDPAARVEWAKKQVYISLGFALAQAAAAEIDACPMEGFDSAKYDEVLGLNALGLTTSVIMTVGFRSADDTHATEPKIRFAKEEVVIER